MVSPFSPAPCPGPLTRGWAARLLALGVLLSVAACGGGGQLSEGAPHGATFVAAALVARAQAAPLADEPAADPGSADLVAPAPSSPGLLPQAPQVVDAAASGERAVIAVGALAGGGHAIVWLAREAGEPEPPRPWTLWTRAYDLEGHPVGPATALVIGQEIPIASPPSVAAAVLPEGRIAVTLLSTEADPSGLAADIVRGAVFLPSGALVQPPRVLDTQRHAIGNPRADRLGGPPVMAAARDGSYLAAWRYEPGSYLGRAPGWRIQRLSSLGAPLGWIHHLPRSNLPADLEPWALRLTPLDEGGWIAHIPRFDSATGWFADITQIDVPRPLGMPLLRDLPARSFVLDLHRRGSVLFTGRQVEAAAGVDSPVMIRFDRWGSERAPAGLIAFPVAAFALRHGDFVGLWPAAGGGLGAQRFSPDGDYLGEPFPSPAPVDAPGAGLLRGGLALAWVERVGDEVRVMTQRFIEPAAGS